MINLLEDSSTSKLPSLPHVLIKLLSACRGDNACFDKISDIISNDTALSTKIISVANSPVYGHARHLDSLKHTLLFLGLDTIKSIAITVSVKQFFSRYSNEKSLFLKQFWKHSLSCATIAKSLAKLTGYEYSEEAYIAGLLHDIAKLIMENHADFEYNQITHGEYPSKKILHIEKQNFEITHDELGAILLEKWGINTIIADAVRYHHAEIEDLQGAHHLVKIINLANILASDLNTDDSAIKLDCSKQLFDLSDPIIINIVNKAEQDVKKASHSMGIDIGENDTNIANDQDKQVALAQEVRDIALTQGAALHIKNNDKTSIYTSIQKSLSILFTVKRSYIFTYNQESDSVISTKNQSLTEGNIIKELSISLNSNSLVTSSLVDKEIKDSLDVIDSISLSIIDQQIIRALETSAMLCLPIIKSEKYIAVIVMGFEDKQQKYYKKNKNLLHMLTNEIADKLIAFNNNENSMHELSESYLMKFNQKSREIIHEVNNPLTIIQNYLHILSKKLDNIPQAQNDINIIKDEIDRVGNIILRCADNINEQPSIEKTKQIYINDLITDLIYIFKSSLFATHNIEPVLNLNDNIGKINVNKDALKQVLTNILKNAVEAIDNKGEIAITTRNTNINGKTYIDIEIIDTGPGIPENILKNLYSPMKTTKAKNHSGLGLHIVKKLITEMNGYIGCRTSKKGTVFNIQLPKKLKTSKS